MQGMDPGVVFWVGLIFGVVSLIAMYIKLFTTEQPGSAVWAPAAVAVVLIGLSVWTKIKIEGGGVSIQVEQRIEALDEELQVATQGIAKAAAAETEVIDQLADVTDKVNKNEKRLVGVTRVLERPAPEQKQKAADLRRTIQAEPKLDMQRLDAARIQLKSIRPEGAAAPPVEE